jgi:hypothetical protein
MENEKRNDWTEETVRPYIFQLVEVSDDGKTWRNEKLIGFGEGTTCPFLCINGFAFLYMRPIKEKKTIVEPWTFKTCPWPLSVVCKSGPEKFTFTAIDKDGAHARGCVFTYDYLKDNFTQLDGSPCGIVREVDA